MGEEGLGVRRVGVQKTLGWVGWGRGWDWVGVEDLGGVD